jgi:hypothetical protein
MGYDSNILQFTYGQNLWVQEFAEKGGGHHEGHVHYDNHIIWFLFFKVLR